ncbi:hypothetical protein N0V90_004494, partial [Kalmusia sp. IMI 367209]
MRLLKIEDDGSLSLKLYAAEPAQKYAILSHTWGADYEGVAFKDLREDTDKVKFKKGYRKLEFCSKQAVKDGLKYFWIDTCCIDETSSAELSEAINSMFQWYHTAAKCYVYLSDVSTTNANDDQVDTAFTNSRWFTRGWTLQELLAPTSVEFFSSECIRLGDRESLMSLITEVTEIPSIALKGNPLSQFSAAARKLWVKKRETTRKEDAAYCLLGIFNVSMSVIYGEGQDRAFRRLQREINGFAHDQSSLHSFLREQLKRDHRSLVDKPPGLLYGNDIAITATGPLKCNVYFQDAQGVIREYTKNGCWKATNSSNVSAKLFTPLTVINFDSGKEIRIYYISEANYLEELCFSSGRSDWYTGGINREWFRVAAETRLAAVYCADEESGPRIR